MLPNSLLKILLAVLFLYIAWPMVNPSLHSFQNLFWLFWLGLFFLVIGGNLATLFKITEPPVIEKDLGQRQKDSI